MAVLGDSSRRLVRAPALSRRSPISNQSLRDEVLRGLQSPRKTLPPKLFYDEKGAQLFEKICEQPEYYVTRAELTILRRCAPEIARKVGPRAALVEYGSGAGVKIRLLLDALEHPLAYVPVDISREQLSRVAHALQQDYPAIAVKPVWADYTRRFKLPHLPASAPRVAFFPGSTIGNFHPTDAASFLRSLRSVIGYDGALVLGVDRVKDTGVLNAAYNDAAGWTARFNINVLDRLDRELDADFDARRFRHRAFFNEQASRIEMHLESTEDQMVKVGGVMIPFRAGETILTECSYKYDEASLDRLVEEAGFEVDGLWTDDADQFWVAYLKSKRRASD
jgi:dimethylhistidine N-methyltransferase